MKCWGTKQKPSLPDTLMSIGRPAWWDQSWCGGRAGEQGSGTPAAGNMDKVRKYSAVETHSSYITWADFRRVQFLLLLWCPPKPPNPVNLHASEESEQPSCPLKHLQATAQGPWMAPQSGAQGCCAKECLSQLLQQTQSCPKESNLLWERPQKTPLRSTGPNPTQPQVGICTLSLENSHSLPRT